MLAMAFREQSACWVHVPTASEVPQQDLGWVVGDPNDYSPDSGDSQCFGLPKSNLLSS